MNLRSRVVLVGGLVAAGFVCASCRREPGRASDSDAGVVADSMGAAPSEISTVSIRTTRNLRENSALALSRDQPGVLFTINDSGNEPILFALDTSGADRGAWRIRGATNVDWEAVAIGSCAARTSVRCVYIGDIGDNDSTHPTRTVYRLAEPTARDSSSTASLAAEALTFTYPGGRHDVEAMYVAGNGDVILITKRALRGNRRLRPALMFRIPSAAWSSKKPVVADLVDSLSIVPGSAPLRLVTDASAASDGRFVAVRTYSQLFVYSADATTGRIDHAVAPAICNLVPLGEAQGEGVSWVCSTGRFAFSSEGAKAPLHLANCPLPR
jgi:hypothetical protein